MSDTYEKIFTMYFGDNQLSKSYLRCARLQQIADYFDGEMERVENEKDIHYIETRNDLFEALDAHDGKIKDLQAQLAEAQQQVQGEPYAVYANPENSDVGTVYDKWFVVNTQIKAMVTAHNSKAIADIDCDERNAEWRAANPVKRYVVKPYTWCKYNNSTGKWVGESCASDEILNREADKLNAQHEAEAEEPKWEIGKSVGLSVAITEDGHYRFSVPTTEADKVVMALNKLEREEQE